MTLIQQSPVVMIPELGPRQPCTCAVHCAEASARTCVFAPVIPTFSSYLITHTNATLQAAAVCNEPQQVYGVPVPDRLA